MAKKPPKKPGKNDEKKKQDDETRKREKEERQAKKRIEGDGWPSWTDYHKRIELVELIGELTKQHRLQDEAAARLPDLIRKHTELLEAGDDDALNDWRAGDGYEATSKRRFQMFEEFRQAQSLLEDFLYYQITAHRRGRLRDKKKTETHEVHGITRGQNYLIVSGPEPYRRKMLNRYDDHKIGGPTHRSGMTDWGGKQVENVSEGTPSRRTVPRELHLWTPSPRRGRDGFAIERNEPILDLEAITQRWREIEFEEITDAGVTYRTHAARREAEVARYTSTRPNTSTILVRQGSDGEEIIDSFRNMRTDEGIFISARESSFDWRTSYDFLGPVKSGVQRQFEFSEERDTIDDALEEEHDTELAPIEFDKRYRLLEEKGRESGLEPPKTVHGLIKKEKEEIRFKNSVSEWKNVHIQYPYREGDLQNTLEDTEGRPHETPDPLVSTEWCEETDGRREWHVHMLYSPASSVDSPPHTPIDRPTDSYEIPEEFPDRDCGAIANSKRRCPHRPEQCRAWWMHTPEECWVVESQAPQPVRSDPILHPFEAIAPFEEFRLPQSGRDIYQERIRDHYGVLMNKEQAALWPRVGIRMPYEPMTFDDLKPNPEGDGQNDHIDESADGLGTPQASAGPSGGGDDNDDTDGKLPRITVQGGREAFEVHSLAAPLIPMSPGTAYPLPRINSPTSSNDSDSDSDDEDLFRKSYQECSAVPPPPATGTSNPLAPEENNPMMIDIQSSPEHDYGYSA